MRGRSRRGSSGTAADFLVCFPSRTHLALMPPKPICSPSRPSASERRHSTSGRPGPPPPSSSSSSASAHYRARNASRRCRQAMDVAGVDDEPSSPKVTCAGQIKVSRSAKPKAACAGKKKPAKKATAWIQALGIKKDALPFLSALHGAFRLNNVAGCFRSFPGAVVEYTSGEEDEEEDEDQIQEEQRVEAKTEHGDALARWFMVLEEGKRIPRKRQEQKPEEEEEEESQDQEESAPPANALMLMRCRSAPAKGLARRLGAGEEELKSAKEEEETHKETTEKENLVVMRYPPDFFHVSVDIAKETWIVGGDDSVLRCRSWKK